MKEGQFGQASEPIGNKIQGRALGEVWIWLAGAVAVSRASDAELSEEITVAVGPSCRIGLSFIPEVLRRAAPIFRFQKRASAIV